MNNVRVLTIMIIAFEKVMEEGIQKVREIL